VELLVVIGIIAILIAMLLPALNKARQSAKTVQCASNMKQVMFGLMMYAHDNKGWFPYSYYRNPDTTLPSAQRPKIFWAGLIGGDTAGYVKDPRVFFCPDRADLGRDPDLIAGLRAKHPVYNSTWSDWAYVSYSVNRHGAMPRYDDALTYNTHPIKLGQPGMSASEYVILVEGHVLSYTLDPDTQYYGWYDAGAGKDRLWIHSGGITNAAYLDGHVAGELAGRLGWDVNTDDWKPDAGSTATKQNAPWYFMVFTKR
jgi:prepilin-type processing-associated H-X9-DG protein